MRRFVIIQLFHEVNLYLCNSILLQITIIHERNSHGSIFGLGLVSLIG